jgi:hypothetical protein
VCCDAGEVCCSYFNPPSYSHYCAQPCSSAIVDTESCNEANEENEKCPGCTHGTIPPFCMEFHWIDYTGLKIKQCYDGCPQNDWNLRNEICYERKMCIGSFKEDQMCLVCQNGEMTCVTMQSSSPPSCYYGVADCIVEIACAILVNCEKCSQTNEVIDTYNRETCDCQ